MSEKNYRSLSEGSVMKTLVTFALPFLLSGLMQMAYSAVDVYFIGKYASAASVSGVYQGVMINAVLTGLFLGITSGGTILLGQCVGAKNHREAAQATGNIITISFIAAVITGAVLLFGGRGIIGLMRVPEEAVEEALNYLFVCTLGIVFIMGYNVVSAVLRSLGDSKAPFFFILTASVINVVLDYVFVGVWGLMAKGAAAATVTAQGVSFLLSVLYIWRKGLPFKFSIRDIAPKKSVILSILKLGVPISLQSTLNNFSFMIAGAIINTMGVYVSAATSVVGTITGICMMVPMSMSSSISAITAQNIGAKKPERAVKTLKYGIVLCLLFAVPFVIAVTFWPEGIVRLLNRDANVVRESVRYLYPYSWDCLFVCFVFCFNGFFNGCGRTLFAMLQEGLSAFLVRIPASYLLKTLVAGATIFHVGIATPLASLASAIACIIYFRIGFTREKLEKFELVSL